MTGYIEGTAVGVTARDIHNREIPTIIHCIGCVHARTRLQRFPLTARGTLIDGLRGILILDQNGPVGATEVCSEKSQRVCICHIEYALARRALGRHWKRRRGFIKPHQRKETPCVIEQVSAQLSGPFPRARIGCVDADLESHAFARLEIHRPKRIRSSIVIVPRVHPFGGIGEAHAQRDGPSIGLGFEKNAGGVEPFRSVYRILVKDNLLVPCVNCVGRKGLYVAAAHERDGHVARFLLLPVRHRALGRGTVAGRVGAGRRRPRRSRRVVRKGYRLNVWRGARRAMETGQAGACVAARGPVRARPAVLARIGPWRLGTAHV